MKLKPAFICPIAQLKSFNQGEYFGNSIPAYDMYNVSFTCLDLYEKVFFSKFQLTNKQIGLLFSATLKTFKALMTFKYKVTNFCKF